MINFPNYNPSPLIPLSRTTNRYVYDEFPYMVPPSVTKSLALRYPNSSNSNKKTKYSYLINNPLQTYGTQSDVYTNPNALGIPRLNTRLISLSKNPTCPNMFPIDQPLLFPSNQTSVVYPINPIPLPISCINYTALDGGELSVNLTEN